MDTLKKSKKEKDFNVQLITSEREFDDLADEWNTLVGKCNLHIFQTFEWQRIWWDVFGGKNPLHIVTVRNEGKLVGILPTFLDSFGIGGITIYRCLRMLGSTVMQPEEGSLPVVLSFSSYMMPIIHPNFSNRVCHYFIQYLLQQKEDYDRIFLEEMPEDSLFYSEILEKQKDKDLTINQEDASVCPLIKLPNSWSDLLNDLSSNARYQIRRNIRRIADENLFEFKTASQTEEVKRVFRRLVQFHQDRWQSIGQAGIFADERVLRFYRKISFKFHEKDWLQLKYLEVEGKCVAVDLLFQFNDMIYLSQRGFDASSEYCKYGPGNVLLYAVIKECIEKKLNCYQFLRGKARYKMRTANHIVNNKQLTLMPHGQQGFKDRQKDTFVKSYVECSRMLRSEFQNMKIHFNRRNVFEAFGSYGRRITERISSKLENVSSS